MAIPGINHSTRSMRDEHRRIEKLRLTSEDLLYEIDMLDFTAKTLLRPSTGNSRIRNAVIESFAIHARNLIYFLYADKPKRDELTASKYFARRAEWEDTRPPITGVLKVAWGRADREIAHLTFGRQKVAPENKGWPIAAIQKDLAAAFRCFLLRVPENLMPLEAVRHAKLASARTPKRPNKSV